jgi:hypothetical protein
VVVEGNWGVFFLRVRNLRIDKKVKVGVDVIAQSLQSTKCTELREEAYEVQ